MPNISVFHISLEWNFTSSCQTAVLELIMLLASADIDIGQELTRKVRIIQNSATALDEDLVLWRSLFLSLITVVEDEWCSISVFLAAWDNSLKKKKAEICNTVEWLSTESQWSLFDLWAKSHAFSQACESVCTFSSCILKALFWETGVRIQHLSK